MHKKIFSKGFTLIELIIVIGILSILSIAVLAVFNPVTQIQKTNDARRKADLSQIQKSLETYYQDNGRYPDSSTVSDLCNSAPCPYRIKSVDVDNPVKNWGQPWQPYMNILPKDPNPSNHYVYVSAGSGQAYYLYANLDRGSKDPQACNGGQVCSSLTANGNACGGVCNYGVSSPNVTP